MTARYRVHLYAADGNGRWIASADFPRPPTREQVNEELEALRGPGWFEVRVCRLTRGGEELYWYAWTQEDGTPGRKSRPAGGQEDPAGDAGEPGGRGRLEFSKHGTLVDGQHRIGRLLEGGRPLPGSRATWNPGTGNDNREGKGQ